MNNLFAYGTLMCDDIVKKISGLHLLHEYGVLSGYQRVSVKGEYYPAIIHDKESSVVGVVYRNIPIDVWTKLDQFEGDTYDRREVKIELANKTSLDAMTYVLKSEYAPQIDSVEWDFEKFLRKDKIKFIQGYKGFFAL